MNIIKIILKKESDLEQLRKILLLHLTILTGGTLLYSLSAIVFFEGIPLLAIIDFLTATFLVSIRVYPKKTNDYICAKNDGMGSTFSFTLPI